MIIDVSKDHVDSIFRVKKSKNNDLTVPEDSGNRSLRNFGQYSPIDNILHPRWVESFITVLLGTHSFESQYYIVNSVCSMLVWILRRTDSTDWHHSNESGLKRMVLTTRRYLNLMFWCFSDRASWIDYILITNLMHWLLFIKYYSPLHVSSLKCSSSGGYSCVHAAYGTVTLYEISWWPVGTQLYTSCAPTGHQELSKRVTVSYAACTQLYPPEDEHLRLKTCRGEQYFMNK